MKKLFILSLTLLLVMSGCGDKEITQTSSEMPTSEPDKMQNSATPTENPLANLYGETRGKYGEFVEEQQLVEAEGVKVYLEGIHSNEDVNYLRVRVENGNPKEIADVYFYDINVNGVHKSEWSYKHEDVFPTVTEHVSINVTSPLNEPFETSLLDGQLVIGDNKYPFLITVTSDKYDGVLSEPDVSSLYKLYESEEFDLYASREYSTEYETDWLNVTIHNKSDNYVELTISGTGDNAQKDYMKNFIIVGAFPGMWATEDGALGLNLPSKDFTGNLSFDCKITRHDLLSDELPVKEKIVIDCTL